MTPAVRLLDDGYTRIGEHVSAVVDGLSANDLSHRIAPEANTIGWLVWHLLRVQDDHVADVAGSEQVWTSKDWSGRFGLPFERDATGYGQTPDEVAAVSTTSELLAGYAADVVDATRSWLRDLTDDDLDRVVDESWDPPVTLGARLLSVIEDDLLHLGQAQYLRGLR